MPRCSPSPYRIDRYSKYDPINGEYSCEVCPSPAMIISEIGNLRSPPPPPNGNEESFIEYLQRGATSTDPTMRNKYGDLLINLEQCGNYTEYGIDSREAGINYNDLTAKTSVDTGKWTLLSDITSDYLDICPTMEGSSQEDLSVTDNRICEIVNFYVNTDGYLTGSVLDNAIKSQFGTPSTMNNNELERVLPPLPEELYSGGGNTVEDYKNFIHQNRGAYIRDDIFGWIRYRRTEGGRNAIPPPSVDNILMEEIYEAWIELTNFKRNTPGASDALDGLSIQSFFEGQPSSIEFEMCMNNIFDNQLHDKYKDFDYNIQERISKHKDITQLHPREVDYIEDKLKIIATLNPEDAMECMNILNIGEMICDKGVSDRMLKMGYLVMHIIGLDKMHLDGIQPGTHKYQKLKHILDRLTPYIRRAVKKIIDISKYYEKQTCGFESASTHILETIYDDVFEKTKEVDLNIQGLDLIPTYLIKDTNMMEFARTIILLIVMIAGIYVLMMILNRPVAVASA